MLYIGEYLREVTKCYVMSRLVNRNLPITQIFI
ncbi:MAG: hypothetical protein ACI8O8_003184, partial [Oleiphilaceae bacterium]